MEGRTRGEEVRQGLLVHVLGDEECPAAAPAAAPKDAFGLAYATYFILGAGLLLPFNAFIMAIDYFSYLYPDAAVDSVFTVTYMVSGFLVILTIIGWAQQKSNAAAVRINVGFALFVVSLLTVPIMDTVYVRGVPGLYPSYYVTTGALMLCGIGSALAQAGITGSAGEMPERYMQASVAGGAASGVLVSALRIMTKAVYPQDVDGLRRSANLHFSVSIAIIVVCIVCHCVADRLPVIQYYKDIKLRATMNMRSEEIRSNGKGSSMSSGTSWKSTLWHIVGVVKWTGLGMFLLLFVSLSISPGYITVSFHSEVLKDWYPIVLLTAFSVFDLVGKSLTAVYLPENANVAVALSAARLVFIPLFLFVGSVHGPEFLRGEIPVTVLTCLFAATGGYFGSVIMILAPKSVPIQCAETAGVLMLLFVGIGLCGGSIVSWFLVI